MNHSDRISDIKAGGFVLVALIVLVAGSLWIAGSTLFGARKVSYRVTLDESGGLQAGDRVRVAGVSVGRIQRLDLRTDRVPPVDMLIGIQREFEIRADSTARVATTGLVGQAYLDINPGSPTAPLLTEGQHISGVASPGIDAALKQVGDIAARAGEALDQTTAILDTVSERLGPLLANLSALLSESNAEDVHHILSRLRATSDDVGPRVSSLLERLDAISAQLEGGVEGLPELSARLSEVVDGLQVALGPDGARLTAVLESTERGVNQAGDALSVVGQNRGELEATIHDLRDVVSNLKAFSQQVKERPSSLVRIKAVPDRKPGQDVPAGGR